MNFFEALSSILIFLTITNLTAMTLQHKKTLLSIGRHVRAEETTASSLASNVPTCPECSQPTTKHLATCSLNGVAKEASKPQPISRGCTICGEKGHYAKKCPKAQKGEKPNENNLS